MTLVREVVSESALFEAYKGDPAVVALKAKGLRKERRPCACRGVVEADPADPFEGVAAHNETLKHAAWRAKREA